MTNIQIAICDDDSTFLKLIEGKIYKFYKSKDEMPHMTGIEVVTRLHALYD